MIGERDLVLGDGRVLHVYDSGPSTGAELTVIWMHGTPQNGLPPQPLVDLGTLARTRWLSHDRPGYAGSDPQPGRTVASVAADVAAIADSAGVDRFAVLGASGGGPHALACARLLGHRVTAAAVLAGLAPYDPQDLDWYAGMGVSGGAEFRAAVAGRHALWAHLAAEEYDATMFAPADLAALEGGVYAPWMLSTLADALVHGGSGLIDDDLAFVAPWGFEVADITVPLLLVHGTEDRFVPIAHSRWLASHCRGATLWEAPEAGHISVFDCGSSALDWLVAQSAVNGEFR
jgi:pimeloyl-ACP methyl ester carboxylesterase